MLVTPVRVVTRPTRTSSDLYSFRRNDTYLHTFGIRNGDILFHILYHRFTVCLLCLHGITCIFLSWTNSLLLNVEQFYIDVTYCLFGLCTWIWLIFAILSVHKKILMLIIKKFDFWIKILFCILFIISYNSWLFVTNRDVKTLNNLTFFYVYIIESGLISIDFILIITYYCLINGMQIKFKNKLYFGIVLSLFCMIFSIQFLLYAGNHEKNIYTQIYPNYVSISWYSISLSSIQILTLFLFKTIYLSRKYKDKSTVINTIPTIKWINEHNTNTITQNSNINSFTQNNNNINLSETVEGKDEYSDVQSAQNPSHVLTNLQGNEYSDQSESLTPTPQSASSHSITVKPTNNNSCAHHVSDSNKPKFSKSTSL